MTVVYKPRELLNGAHINVDALDNRARTVTILRQAHESIIKQFADVHHVNDAVNEWVELRLFIQIEIFSCIRIPKKL